MCAVVIGRMTVLIANEVLAEPLVSVTGLVVNVQVAPLGKPELQDSDTESGNDAFVGTVDTVAVYAAGVPAGTVALAGETAKLKDVTVAAVFAEAVKLVPGTDI